MHQFGLAAILDFKMAAILNYIFHLISQLVSHLLPWRHESKLVAIHKTGGNTYVCNTKDSIKSIVIVPPSFVEPPSWISKWPAILNYLKSQVVGHLETSRLCRGNTHICHTMDSRKGHSYSCTDFGFSRHLGFQNGGHHFELYISSYISACESPRGIKLVAIPMFVIPRIPLKALL